MTVFQRAEASTFWGREIGLMYIHAHLRYAEALARVGDGDGAAAGTRPGEPGGRSSAGAAGPPAPDARCYYSSLRRRLHRPLRRLRAVRRPDGRSTCPSRAAGGSTPPAPAWCCAWSSSALLGIRQRGDDVEVDPVLPAGQRARRRAAAVRARRAGSLTVRYVVGPEGVGVHRVTVGGRELDLRPLTNPYRRAGVVRRTVDDLLAAALDGNGVGRPSPSCVETH